MTALIDRLHELLDKLFPAPVGCPVPVRVKTRGERR